MFNENQEPKYHKTNFLNVLAGLMAGLLTGAATMLLLAPQSGKNTRDQIREKGIELRDQTTGMLEAAMEQVRSNANKITTGGQETISALKQQGQELAVEQLDRVSRAARAGRKAIKRS